MPDLLERDALAPRHWRQHVLGVRGSAIDNAVAQWQENSGAVNHARGLRRMLNRTSMGWDVRTSGGLATSGTANGGVARHYGSATTGDLSVQQRIAGANMSVDVLLGACLLGGTEHAHQGEYLVYGDATFNVAITASDPANPRIDIVGVQVRDSEYSGGTTDARIVVVTGTPAGVPAEPALPADFLTLARVDVAAAAGSVINANITDRRRRISALGGITVATSSATYPTVNLWTGMAVFDVTRMQLMVYDGAAWQRGPWFSSAGRTECRLRRSANQACAQGVDVSISWDTEDSDPDGFIVVTATTLTVPAGLGGIYSVYFFATFSTPAGAGAHSGGLVLNSRGHPTTTGLAPTVSTDVVSGTTVQAIAAGGTIIAHVSQGNTAGGEQVTGRLEVYRIGP